MATYYSNSNNSYRLRLDVTNRDGNSATNTSVIDYGFYLEQTNKRFNGNVQTGDLTINGVSLYSKPTSFNSTTYPYNSSILLKSGSLTVSHTSDGSKTVSLVANYSANSGGFGPVGLAINTTFGLTTIPRASQPRLSVSTQNLGSTITIYTDRASDSFTHTLKYQFGSYTDTSTTGVGVSHTWTLPNNFANAIPSATSGVGTITCETYNSGTLIGTKTVNFTAKVPNTATFKPTANTPVVVAGNTLPSGVTGYVQNHSKVKVTSSGTGKFGSSISAYTVAVGGVGTYYGSPITSGFLTSSGTIYITLTVTDSRGFTGSSSTSIYVQPYSPPRLNSFSASRSTSNPVDILANFEGSISEVEGNYRYFRIRSLATGGGWNVETDTTQMYSFSGTQYITSDPDKTYTIEFFAQDSFYSTTQTVQVGTAFTLIDFNTSGKGMAIGKVSEIDGFEVAIPTFLSDGGNVAKTIMKYAYSAGFFVDLCPDYLNNMVVVEVIGNGYGDIPIDTVFQAYHYQPLGTIINAKQLNNGAILPQGTFMIHNGRLKLWFQQSSQYQTMIVKAYSNIFGTLAPTITELAKPVVTYQVACTVTNK